MLAVSIFSSMSTSTDDAKRVRNGTERLSSAGTSLSL